MASVIFGLAAKGEPVPFDINSRRHVAHRPGRSARLSPLQTGTQSAVTRYDPFGAARPGSTIPTGIGYGGERRDATASSTCAPGTSHTITR